MRSIILINSASGVNEPIAAIPVARAIALILSGKAISVRDSGIVFHSEKMRIAIPSVIKLSYAVNVEGDFTRHSLYRYSKQGVLARDNYTCAYCEGYGDTIDHVVPRALGGVSSYENCVAACRECNEEKAAKTLEEMGWELSFSPSVPSLEVIASLRKESYKARLENLQESLSEVLS